MNALRRDEGATISIRFMLISGIGARHYRGGAQPPEFLLDVIGKIVGAMCDTQAELKNDISRAARRDPDARCTPSRRRSEQYRAYAEGAREQGVPPARDRLYHTDRRGAPRSGKPHDGRAPDYDDWSLNGDIMIWYAPMECALELSSMGIRVNAESLRSQQKYPVEGRAALPFHRALLDGELPLTVGGGIGQSRLAWRCLPRFTSERSCSVWPEDMVKACADAGIALL